MLELKSKRNEPVNAKVTAEGNILETEPFDKLYFLYFHETRAMPFVFFFTKFLIYRYELEEIRVGFNQC